MEDAGAVLIPQEPFAAAYSQEMGIKDGAPSTGFVGEPTRTLLRVLPYMKHTMRKVQVEIQIATLSVVSYSALAILCKWAVHVAVKEMHVSVLMCGASLQKLVPLTCCLHAPSATSCQNTLLWCYKASLCLTQRIRASGIVCVVPVLTA